MNVINIFMMTFVAGKRINKNLCQFESDINGLSKVAVIMLSCEKELGVKFFYYGFWN